MEEEGEEEVNAYVLGNGPSRRLGYVYPAHGPLIGCNYSYKEGYEFDMIASIDAKPTAAISKTGTFRVGLNDGLPNLGNGMGYDSGRLAIYETDDYYDPDKIFLFGFDMTGGNHYPTATNQDFQGPKNYHLAWQALAGVVEADLYIVREGRHKYEKELMGYYEFITHEEFER